MAPKGTRHAWKWENSRIPKGGRRLGKHTEGALNVTSYAGFNGVSAICNI